MGWHQGVRVSIGVVAAGAVLSGSIGNETRCREVRRDSAETVSPALSSSAVYGLELLKDTGPEPNSKEGLPSRGL